MLFLKSDHTKGRVPEDRKSIYSLFLSFSFLKLNPCYRSVGNDSIDVDKKLKCVETIQCHSRIHRCYSTVRSYRGLSSKKCNSLYMFSLSFSLLWHSIINVGLASAALGYLVNCYYKINI